MGGYSRAAAVSNMAAVLMLSTEQIAPETSLSIPSPRPIRQGGKFSEEYDYSSIFNIVGMFDPIPLHSVFGMGAMESWGLPFGFRPGKQRRTMSPAASR